MMKNFTRIILGLAALATSFTSNAELEWREVSKTDFGGNDTNDDIICKVQNADNTVETDLSWYTWDMNYTSGNYMIIKSTDKADVGNGYNLTNWGSALPGSPRWASGGDHTYPTNPNKGYFMAFDCPSRSKVKLYKHVLPVACSGVKFKLEAYFAVLDWRTIASNDVEMSIEAGGVALAKATLNSSSNPDWRAVSQNFKWIPLSVEFSVDDPSINSVDFVVNAINCAGAGWDFGLDDVTISVQQPKIKYVEEKYKYLKPATFKVTYDESEFDNFFKNTTNVKYQWFKDDGTGTFVAISGAGGSYTPGKDLSYSVAQFDKDRDNGSYRLIVAPNDNFGDGNSQNLCAIQKDITINQTINIVDVNLCRDSTKVVEGITLPVSPIAQEINAIYQEATNSSSKSYGFNITVIDSDDGEDVITQYCLDGTHSQPGKFSLPDIITRDENNCPIKIQKAWEQVSDYIVEEPAEICDGDNHITDNGVNHTWHLGEDKEIIFPDGGCQHKQKVYVFPVENKTVEVKVCQGDTYDSSIKKYKTIHGCDSTVTPKIIFVSPKSETIEYLKCPSDNFEFDHQVYNEPTDVWITHSDLSSDGCDSTTNIHIIVMDGGEIHMDTLICRDQILFGKEYDTKGTYTVVRSGFSDSGCSIDTVWTITVVEISLKLRLFNNQTEVCLGQPVSMRATLKAETPDGRELPATHYWEPQIESNQLDPLIYLEEPSEYVYTIYADLDLPAAYDANSKGCHAKESVNIKVNPIPELTVDSVNPDDRSVRYTVTSGTEPYHMYLGSKDLGIMEGNEDTRDHLPYGKHILQVKDNTGCSAEQEITVEATKLEPDMFFTPNGDGQNDYWKVKNIDVYPTSTIKIFDRYGKLLHSGTGSNFDEGWDGTYNGNRLPATDYWYEIDIDEIDTQYYGHFTLMR